MDPTSVIISFSRKFKPRNYVAEKIRLNKKIIKLNFKNFIFYNNCFNANYLYFIISESLIYRKLNKYFEYIRRNIACETSFWKTINIIYFFARDSIKNVETKKIAFCDVLPNFKLRLIIINVF